MLERNALPLIKKNLREKTVEVILPEEGNLIKGYLIKISGDIDPFRDFHIMYQGIGGKAFEKAERRLHNENPEALKNHGVLIDPETMKIVFTFNMAFADLHRAGKKFVRFPLTEIFPVVIPDYYGKPCRDGDPCFGERAKKLVEKYAYFPRGKVANCLASFTDTLAKHAVSVRLPGEDTSQLLYLIKVWAKTNFKEDYGISYPGNFLKRLAAIPEREDEFREYGLFVSPQGLEIVFAFNTAFAKYDSQNKTVEYLTVAENILKRFQTTDEPHHFVPSQSLRSGGMHGVIMYALSEPRK